MSARRCVVAWMSTSGVWPDTVTVSASSPTAIDASTLAVNAAVRTMPSRTTVLKPGSVKVTL